MPTKKSKKNHTIFIDLEREIASPHVLNLKDVKFEKEEPSEFENIKDAGKKSEIKNNFFISPNSEVRKKNRLRHLRMRMRLLFSSIFRRSSFEPMAIKPHLKSSRILRELFVVNLVSLIFLIAWKALRIIFSLVWSFINSFLSLFKSIDNYKEDEVEEIKTRVGGARKMFLSRPIRLREAVFGFLVAAFILVLPLRLFLTYEGLVEIKEKVISAGEATLGHITLAFEGEAEDPVGVFTKVGTELNFASSQIEKINFFIRNIISLLPEKGEQFKLGESLLKTGIKLTETASNVLGIDEPRRYLLIFQNNNEIRPTGGFIGSFAEVYIRNGKIEKTYFPGGGSYDLDGGLTKRLIPPEPLQLIAGRWHFRDANWFPDFPTSAQKLMWFYEKSGGGTVDGVIAFNAAFVEDMLKFIGPIQMPEYDKTLTADNFINEVQHAVEIEYDKEENKPKQILADLMPVLTEKLLSTKTEDAFEISKILDNALQTRDIQFYFEDEEIEKLITDLGWGGEIKNTSGDYFAIFNSNIAGQKTDSVVDEKIEHETKIDSDGNIVNIVRVKRTHSGIKGDLFTGVRNVNYARIYVPKGSILLHASGFERPDSDLFDVVEEGCEPDVDAALIEKSKVIDPRSGTRTTEEFGKTVFGNWTMTDPGKTTSYTLSYRLPVKLNFEEQPFFESLLQKDNSSVGSYNLFVQRQSGTNRTTFMHSLRLPENMEEIWYYRNSETGSVNKRVINLDNDKFYGKLIKLIK